MIDTWPGWESVRKIGEGSYGEVYEIYREEFGFPQRAALKVITIPKTPADVEAAYQDGLDEQSVTDYFYSFVEELVTEFALMYQLKSNNMNIVSYEDHMVIPHEDEIGWTILIRMELLTPLTKYAGDHTLTEEEIIRLGMDICNALEICHEKGIIHRDIKPENIFYSDTGHFKLGDFGVAKVAEKTMSNFSQKGTCSYMAPEVYRGVPYGFRVDIYSLGIVLYRYLNCGRLPFLPDFPEKIFFSDKEKALEKRMSGTELLPPPKNGSEKLKNAVLRACAYEPEERYQTPGEFRAALEEALNECIRARRISNVKKALIKVAQEKRVSDQATGVSNESADAQRETSSFGYESEEQQMADDAVPEKTLGIFSAGRSEAQPGLKSPLAEPAPEQPVQAQQVQEQVKVQPQPGIQPQVQEPVQPQQQVEVQTQPQMQAQPQPQVEVQTKPRLQPQPQPQVEPQSQPAAATQGVSYVQQDIDSQKQKAKKRAKKKAPGMSPLFRILGILLPILVLAAAHMILLYSINIGPYYGGEFSVYGTYYTPFSTAKVYYSTGYYHFSGAGEFVSAVANFCFNSFIPAFLYCVVLQNLMEIAVSGKWHLLENETKLKRPIRGITGAACLIMLISVYLMSTPLRPGILWRVITVICECAVDPILVIVGAAAAVIISVLICKAAKRLLNFVLKKVNGKKQERGNSK